MEALRPTDDDNQGSISSSVIYYKSDSTDPYIKNFITANRSKENVTFVIDECDSQLHSSLVKDVKADDSNINLVTISNEPDYSETGDSNRILLKPDTFKSVVADMINDIYKDQLLGNDRSKIIEFAGGFPSIAVHLADKRMNKKNTLEFTDDYLIRKILWGTEDEDKKETSILQACSIFKHFKLEDDNGDIEEQSKFICDTVLIGETVNYSFFVAAIKKFQKRNIIQKHGRYYKIEPVPLALRLAKQWWELTSFSAITEILEKVQSKGLLDSFCEQSRRFDFIPQAADLVEKLCGNCCPFDDAKVVLSVAGSRIFRAFAEVNPTTVTDCLYRILSSPDINPIEIVHDVRRNIVWALENLVWHENTFEKSAKMLEILALAENENWANNATGLFLQLFHVWLPGTKADLLQRQKIIDGLVGSDNDAEKKLVIKILKHVFYSGPFTRSGGVESQGTKGCEKDYYPTREEMEKYWHTNFNILTDLISSETKLSEDAKQVFVECTGSIIRQGHISWIENSVKKILEAGIFWHGLLVKIEKLLIREDAKLDNETKNKIEALSVLLLPQSWPDKIRHYISNPDWLHKKNEQGNYINLSDKKAEEIADELSSSSELWELLPLLYEGEQRQGISFGNRLALKLKDSKQFLEKSIATLENCQNPNITVLGGFLRGLNNTDTTIDVLLKIANSKKLITYLPSLLASTTVTKKTSDLILSLITEQKLSIKNLNVFKYGQPLEYLEPKEVENFCRKLSKYNTDGARYALEILYMHCFGTPDRFSYFENLFIEILLNDNLISENEAGLELHTWTDLVKKYIPRHPNLASHICKELILYCSSDILNKYQSISHLKDVTIELLKNDYGDIWPHIGKALLDDSNWELREGIKELLEIEAGEVKKEHLSPLANMPYDYLKNWCNQHVPKGPANIMGLLAVIWENDDNTFDIDELSRNLLLDFGEHEEVRNAASRQLFSFTSWGSREPYYLRRIKILENLKNLTVKTSLISWIDSEISFLKKEAQKSKNENDEFQAGIH